jgi:hypothetical protein
MDWYFLETIALVVCIDSMRLHFNISFGKICFVVIKHNCSFCTQIWMGCHQRKDMSRYHNAIQSCP